MDLSRPRLFIKRSGDGYPAMGRLDRKF